jgi:predicted AlkP superfamily pyrophosphatase or phosphodiesterase
LSARVRAAAAALLCVAAVVPRQPARAHCDVPRPRLVLVIAVDQLGADRLQPSLPGGLGRLLREGRSFADAVLDHADTETCPGHATMLSGRQPGPYGVGGNEFVDQETGALVYCVDDPSSPVLGGRGGRSPRPFRGDALGDWLKATLPNARVYAVSGKDRAAIAMGGRRPDAAYWFDLDAAGFTTSTWYRSALPAWVVDWNGEGTGGFLEALPERWDHPTGDPGNGATADDAPGESTLHGATSGHPLREADRARTLKRLYFTPMLDEVTLDFARELVVREDLGRTDVTDLLAVGLSATDTVGHLYGPDSQEARDAQLRLDALLGDFLAFLESRSGVGRVLVVLTSDHGVLPLPEHLAQVGHNECPVGGGRVAAKPLNQGLAAALAAAYGDAPADRPWLRNAGLRLTVNRSLARERGVSVDALVATARAWLQGQPAVQRTWTAAEQSAGSGPEPFGRLYRNSWDPERGGDLVVQPAAGCLVTDYPAGTSHGSPYLYDRAVPIVFWGTGVAPGVARDPARTVDIAPTLAHHLGIDAPADLDGVRLRIAEPAKAP